MSGHLVRLTGWAGLFLVLLGAKLAVIHHFAVDVPYWDQWDGEADAFLRPLLEGTLQWNDWWKAHNEHRIVFTRLLTFLTVQLNGLWEPKLVMVVQAGLHALAFCLFLGMATGGLSRVRRLAVLGVGSLLFVIPFGWENTLSGFQSQFYFQILFGLGTLYGCWKYPALSKGFWLSTLWAGVGLFTMASGLLAPLACVVLLLLRFRHSPKGWERELLGAMVMGAVVVAGGLLRQHVPGHDALKAPDLGSLLWVFLKVTSWPVASPWVSGLFLVPPLVLLVRGLRAQWPQSDARWLLLGLALWGSLQAAVIAYGRNAFPLDSRYTDNYVLFLCIAFACLWRLRPVTVWGKRAFAAVVASWALVVGWGVVAEFDGRTLQHLRDKRTKSERQQQSVRAFLATRDEGHLSGDIPYPKKDRLRGLLENAALASVLPSSVRAPLWATEVVHQRPGFVERGFYSGVAAVDTPPVWGSYGAQGDLDQGAIELRFEGSRRSRLLRLYYTGYPAREGLSLVVVDAQGKEQRVATVDAREDWKLTYLRVPPGPFFLRAQDQSPSSWLAFSLPSEVGRVSVAVNRLLEHFAWVIAAGLALLAGAGLWRQGKTSPTDQAAAEESLVEGG